MNRKVVYSCVIVVIAIGAAFYFDNVVGNAIADHPDPQLNSIMRNVSRVGDWPAHLGLGVVLAGVAWWRGHKRWTRIFLSMLLALALAGVAARVIKISVGRARPSAQAEQTWNGPKFSSKYHAFPSGHVAASSAFFGVLLFANWRIGLACMSIPLLIGFSRMYVAAHYLSDIVCAMILGLICAAVVGRWLLPKSNIEHQTSNV